MKGKKPVSATKAEPKGPATRQAIPVLHAEAVAAQRADVLEIATPADLEHLRSGKGGSTRAMSEGRKPEPIACAVVSETEAAVAIARAWLAKAGFHEDPAGEDPARIEIQGPGWDGRNQEHYVDVRVYIPNLDVEHVVEGTHPDGITAEAP